MADRDAGGKSYKTVAMPTTIRSGRKFGKSRADRVAQTMCDIINKEAAQGWSYVGSDTIRNQERQGLFGSVKECVYTVLVFERAMANRIEPSIAEEAAPRRSRSKPDALEEATRNVRRAASQEGGRTPRRGYGYDEELTAERDEERRPMRRREARMASRRNGEENYGRETNGRDLNGRDANGRGSRGLVETMRQHRDRS